MKAELKHFLCQHPTGAERGRFEGQKQDRRSKDQVS
jgi:hypothetical protein